MDIKRETFIEEIHQQSDKVIKSIEKPRGNKYYQFSATDLKGDILGWLECTDYDTDKFKVHFYLKTKILILY